LPVLFCLPALCPSPACCPPVLHHFTPYTLLATTGFPVIPAPLLRGAAVILCYLPQLSRFLYLQAWRTDGQTYAGLDLTTYRGLPRLLPCDVSCACGGRTNAAALRQFTMRSLYPLGSWHRDGSAVRACGHARTVRAMCLFRCSCAVRFPTYPLLLWFPSYAVRRCWVVDLSRWPLPRAVFFRSRVALPLPCLPYSAGYAMVGYARILTFGFAGMAFLPPCLITWRAFFTL